MGADDWHVDRLRLGTRRYVPRCAWARHRPSIYFAALVACSSLAACSDPADDVGYKYGTDSFREGDGISGAASGDPRINRRVWRLTPMQINDEVRLFFGEGAPQFNIPESAAESGITNLAANGVVDQGNAARFVDGARAVGTWVAQQGGSTTRCTNYADAACIDTLLGWLPRGAFRRPLRPEELTELRSLFTDLRAAYDHDYAIAGVVRAVLLSPDFLYRTELGGDGVMTPYEIANLLAFAITDRSPDGMLFDAAELGELRHADLREVHARRLMATSDRTWQRLFWEWLSLETLHSQGAEVGLSQNLIMQMEEEFRAFVTDVAVTRRSTLRELLSAPYTWVRPELAAHYGARHPGGGLARVELNPLQRGGLLTQGAWLVSHGKAGHDNVVRRGMSLFKEAMCNNNLVPPAGLDVNAALVDLVGPDATVREVVDARSSAPSCGGCHYRADPMGMVFENYASNGSWRATYENGMPVDTAVELESLGSFTNAPALSAALVDDAAFQACFVRRTTHYLVGIDMGAPAMAAWVQHGLDAFVRSDTSLEELLVAIVRYPAFIERPPENSP